MSRLKMILVVFILLILLGSLPVLDGLARPDIGPQETYTVPAGQLAALPQENILPTATHTRPRIVPVTTTPTQTSPTREPWTETPTRFVQKDEVITPEPARLPPEQWKEWPVMSLSVSDELREVYQRGLDNGNNPHAFSILGDCQSQPDVFMGIFDEAPEQVGPLTKSLSETVRQFRGSFNRRSPTIKDGMTEGALLFYLWNDNPEKKCTHGETPIDCELRTHQPSIVFFHVGTHWEARNERYTRIIIEKVLAHGAIPVMVTKADNRELDERVNETITHLATEYNLPLWNFWASVQDLPNHGMVPGSDMYLNKEGLAVHRRGALEALDAVWHAARSE